MSVTVVHDYYFKPDGNVDGGARPLPRNSLSS